MDRQIGRNDTLRYWKKTAVAALSIICFLLSMAATVLGEPVAQAEQVQTEAQPNDEGTTQMPAAPVTAGIMQTSVQAPVFTDTSSSAIIASAVQPGMSPMLPTNKTSESPAVKTFPEQRPPAVEPKPIVKPEAKTPVTSQKKAVPAKAATVKPQVQVAEKPAPKITVKSNVTELKKTEPGLISRIISATKGLIGRAIAWLGTRYIWGGISKKGVDCSGLTKLLYKSEGVDLPRTAKQQFKVGQAVSKSSLLPGDLVFFNTRGPISHVGMYIGNGQFVHAANPRRGVRVDKLDSGYYLKRFAGARRYKSFG